MTAQSASYTMDLRASPTTTIISTPLFLFAWALFTVIRRWHKTVSRHAIRCSEHGSWTHRASIQMPLFIPMCQSFQDTGPVGSLSQNALSLFLFLVAVQWAQRGGWLSEACTDLEQLTRRCPSTRSLTPLTRAAFNYKWWGGSDLGGD